MVILIVVLQFIPTEYIPPDDTLTLYCQHDSVHKFVVFTDSIRYQEETIFRIEKIKGLAGAIEGDTIKLFIKRDDCVIHTRRELSDPTWSRYFIIKEKE